MLSIPPMTASIILQNNSLAQTSYIEQYVEDKDFKNVYASFIHGKQIEEKNYYLHDNLLYCMGKNCIP